MLDKREEARRNKREKEQRKNYSELPERGVLFASDLAGDAWVILGQLERIAERDPDQAEAYAVKHLAEITAQLLGAADRSKPLEVEDGHSTYKKKARTANAILQEALQTGRPASAALGAVLMAFNALGLGEWERYQAHSDMSLFLRQQRNRARGSKGQKLFEPAFCDMAALHWEGERRENGGLAKSSSGKVASIVLDRNRVLINSYLDSGALKNNEVPSERAVKRWFDEGGITPIEVRGQRIK